MDTAVVDDTDRVRRVEAGGAPKSDAGESGQRRDGPGERALRIADIRPETDVRTDPSLAHDVKTRISVGPIISRDA